VTPAYPETVRRALCAGGVVAFGVFARGAALLGALLAFGCVDPAPKMPPLRDGSPPLDAGSGTPDSPLLANGNTCLSGQECRSGFCRHGRCCNEACAALCFACDLPAAPGTCLRIAAGGDSRGGCPAEPASGCGLDGTCDGAGACRKHVAGTICVPASCSPGAENEPGICTGEGVCREGIRRGCGDYQCDPATALCRVSCSQPEHCQPGYICSGTSCVTPGLITRLVVHDDDGTRAGLWSVEPSFQIGQAATNPWADPQWAETYVASLDPAAAALLGHQWVRVSTESKQYTGGPQATLTLQRAADVYMMVDARWGASPSWTTGWASTGWTASVYEGKSARTFSFLIFRRSVEAGNVDLPAIGSSMAYNYFIIARPAGS
jgi:hypothetical protein